MTGERSSAKAAGSLSDIADKENPRPLTDSPTFPFRITASSATDSSPNARDAHAGADDRMAYRRRCRARGAPDPSLPGIGSMITATLISEMGEDRASFA